MIGAPPPGQMWGNSARPGLKQKVCFGSWKTESCLRMISRLCGSKEISLDQDFNWVPCVRHEWLLYFIHWTIMLADFIVLFLGAQAETLLLVQQICQAPSLLARRTPCTCVLACMMCIYIYIRNFVNPNFSEYSEGGPSISVLTTWKLKLEGFCA